MTNKSIEERLTLIKDTVLNTIRVDEIYLFGSHAYGQPTHTSDIDIYVVIPDDEIRPIDAMCKIGLATSKISAGSLDILVAKNTDFSKRKILPGLERVISEQGIKIYG